MLGAVQDPSKPLGQRWTAVADSQIRRLYHSVSFLTQNAEVCALLCPHATGPGQARWSSTPPSACTHLHSPVHAPWTWLPMLPSVGSSRPWLLQVWISGSEVTAEFRGQIYTPDYLKNGKPRPNITDTPTSVMYGETFSFAFDNVETVDRVVFLRLAGAHGRASCCSSPPPKVLLVLKVWGTGAPCAGRSSGGQSGVVRPGSATPPGGPLRAGATHGNHMDQRSVVLDCSPGSGTATCTSPPNSSIAPPGIYYLFAHCQGVPSVAEFVSVGRDSADPTAAANVPATAPEFSGIPATFAASAAVSEAG